MTSELARVAEPSTPNQEELALIAKAQAGDQQAYAVLVERYQRFVYNIAFNIVHGEEEAADLAQDTFLRVWQALPNYRAEARFSTWLYRIVYNLSLNRLEVLQRRRRNEQQDTTTSPDGEEEISLLERAASPEDEQPAQQYEQAERRGFIWEQVNSLPSHYRSIITMYYGQQLSYEEIAAVTGQPLGTVKTHLHRAKALLRERLASYAPDNAANKPRPSEQGVRAKLSFLA